MTKIYFLFGKLICDVFLLSRMSMTLELAIEAYRPTPSFLFSFDMLD